MTSTLERPSDTPSDIDNATETTTAATGAAKPPRRRSRFTDRIRRSRRSAVWFVPVLVLGAVAQIVNLAGSPQRIDDEGTYTAQAWAIDKLGELTHYTYWYDHPPLGWLQLAGYAKLTGAFDRYDTAVLAGREFMVVSVIVSAALLWVLARRLRFSRPAAAITLLLFTLSPLALQFHRSVYLDNIATPWLIGSIILAMSHRKQLASFIGSAACLGIAVLSKETFLLALPLVAWLMWRNAHPATRRYTLSVAASVLALIGLTYVLLAAVKGEVFSGAGHASLIDGLSFQLSNRQSSGSIGDPNSLINKTFSMWWQLDPVFIVAGVVAGIVALFIRRLRPFAILLLALVAFMFRPGGYLPVPYIIALLPFGALLVVGVVQNAVQKLLRTSKATPARRVTAAVVIVATVAAGVVAAPLWSTQLRGFFLADLDQPTREAQAWIDANVGRESRLIVDDSMWVDSVNAGFARQNVTWYYKVDTDPAVQALSPNGWRDSDYVITTNSMRSLLSTFPQVNQAVDNSVVVASFGLGDQQVDVRKIDPDGITQATTDADTASKARSSAGTQLAANTRLTLAPSAKDLLTGGQVDSRGILALGQLLAQSSVTVSDFPLVDGEQNAARRQILISSINGQPTPAGSLAAADVSAYFSSLTNTNTIAPTLTQTADGVLVTFAFGEPTGLLPTPQN
ncbi:ArnT family glycosyltransferase [Subtercola vilae]|uniref:Phospholipid carrier-dependent glycosyltransferase n=1 Tax=Subtercola vilae TaxID=2056433 RepID=A0A4T2C5C1_9MICO|nr:hypothetical protein [Subtercola vilae]TIH39320.1 hypothetical protein D4765_04370 [Subtercola vilae]